MKYLCVVLHLCIICSYLLGRRWAYRDSDLLDAISYRKHSPMIFNHDSITRSQLLSATDRAGSGIFNSSILLYLGSRYISQYPNFFPLIISSITSIIISPLSIPLHSRTRIAIPIASIPSVMFSLFLVNSSVILPRSPGPTFLVLLYPDLNVPGSWMFHNSNQWSVESP